MRFARGCGCATVLAVILIASLVMWAMSYFNAPNPVRKLEPVASTIPPNPGAEVANIDVHGPGRTADKLTVWAEDIARQTDVDPQAIRAYGNAELIARDAWPQCNLKWNTLAGIGWVETRHGTYSGNWLKPSKLDANGVATPKIIGIPLDGTNGTAKIDDTDGGKLDGDTVYDRALGPLQFIPHSWVHYGLDGNGDGIADPQQIDDAAVSAAGILCFGGRDLSQEQEWTSAVLGYNRSREYLQKVALAANSYAMLQPATH